MHNSYLFIILLSASIAFGTFSSNHNPTFGRGTKPHIVYLLADDLGWNNVGWRNPDMITPVLDDMKHNGIELDRHYTALVCGPTRSSLMTGRVPIHVREVNNNVAIQDIGPELEMTFLSEKMQEAGYETHYYGKWHLGMGTPEYLPINRGFNKSLFFFSGATDYNTQARDNRVCAGELFVDLWEDDNFSTKNGTYMGFTFNDAAVDAIENHDVNKPMFLFVSFPHPHSPLQVPQEYVDRYADNLPVNINRQLYQAMVTFMDESIGNITQALKDKGMYDDTLIVFSSDNGGPTPFRGLESFTNGGASNFPLKGGKQSDWEGGIRTVGLVGGGIIPNKMRGTVQKGYVHVADWYSTFCFLAGVDPEDTRAALVGLPPIDSKNMWGLFSGQQRFSYRIEIPISSNPTFRGWLEEPTGFINFIRGPYKFLVGEGIPFAGHTGPVYPNATEVYLTQTMVQDCPNGCLYNIWTDPEERFDLAPTRPFLLHLMKWRSRTLEAGAFRRTYLDPAVEACDAARDRGGWWGPFDLTSTAP
mmetsp:Transcript_29351/g.32609  ORF Transcript_29351/g.32609 Transcript_29351/m.32609 type:complete len:530 (+) Transcript_29351:15-1604(+)